VELAQAQARYLTTLALDSPEGAHQR
jgi:hypothetical protein